MRVRLPTIALGIVAAVLSAGLDGCWYGIAQLAPLGLQAVSAIGEGTVNAVGNAVAASHMKKDNPNDPEMEDKCDELAIEVPGIIELRGANAGDAPQWREIRLGGSIDEPQWIAVAEKDAGPDGWRPAENLLKMNFAPPLKSVNPGAIDYLGYAPANPETSTERDQLVALTVDFGGGNGTFDWNGRRYQYAVVDKLPCFPPPIALK